ncbi:MAG TPA: O-antigen ligase family protein [Candidatus Binataceae bacterium]|nr:O-antigen ligase family protein [Candidatus Binataceae bacterium]
MRNRLVDLTDRLVVGGLVVLILATPICFGTVHPWAYHAAETIAFAMLAAVLLRMREERPAHKGIAEVWKIAIPAAALIGLVGFQLLPLPPALLHMLSPHTYDLYEHTLRGWPGTIDYPAPSTAQPSNADSQTVVMPTQSEVAGGAQVPFTAHHKAAKTDSAPVVGAAPAGAGIYASTWRSISPAPLLGIASALKFLAGVALFIIVAIYPITAETPPTDEDPLTRLLIRVILLSGFCVAALGLVQQATWNGKILWFYVPLDWRAPNLNRPRMMGPFVNPDHFAAYLAMIAPLFIARAWRGLAPSDDSRERDEAGPILCSAALVIVICAILLSQSRAIWGAAVVSLAIFTILTSRLRTPSVFRSRRGGLVTWIPILALAAIVVAALAVAIIGSAGRDQIDTRVGTSMAGGLDLWHRVDIWRDTLRMFRDHALLGVGFGAWPEMFPHYQRGAWPAEFLRNAHNDYVEAAAELGILGVLAFMTIGWRIARLVWRRWSAIAPRAQLTIVALVAGMTAEGFHEAFDFSLTIPAIGFLFAIFAGLTVRIAVARAPEPAPAIRARSLGWRAAPYAAAFALMLAVCSQLQASVVYPYYPVAATFTEARAMTLLHPANAGTHLALSSWYGETPAGMSEVARAVWIDPRNPFSRDLYARYLYNDGQYLASLNQLSLSVMWAPLYSDHIYLNARFIPYLSPPERGAIERGLAEAIERGYADAFATLGQFYVDTSRIADAARTYERGAEAADSPARRVQLLMLAGEAYVNVGQLDDAARDFNAARAARPDDAAPCVALLAQVMMPRKDVAGAQDLLKAGLDAGADPAPLLAAFAQVALAAGRPELARDALVKMVDYQPTYDNLLALGAFYAADHDYTRAAEALRRATDVDPQNPRAWFELAGAEDAAYQYVAADRDYLRAADLDPGDAAMRARYAAFKQKLAAGRADASAQAANPVNN